MGLGGLMGIGPKSRPPGPIQTNHIIMYHEFQLHVQASDAMV